jgi:glycogen operon protein
MDDIGWFSPDGTEMSEEDWDAGFAKSLGVFLNGQAIPTIDQRGEPMTGDSFLVLFNAHFEPIDFAIPEGPFGEAWVKELDTSTGFVDEGEPVKAGDRLAVADRSVVVLRHAG